MRIGIYDDLFYSLQNELLLNGHEVVVYAGPGQNIPDENFNVCETQGEIWQAHSLQELVDADCDLYILGTVTEEYQFNLLRIMNKPVVGYSAAAKLLESNREFSHWFMREYGLDDYIRLPRQHVFNSAEEAIGFLEDNDQSWVLKQTSGSPQEFFHNRTLVSRAGNHQQAIRMLQKPNAWFRENGSGGVLLEEFAEGKEVCFGAFFDGSKFLLPIYACQEHKGAQNGDRGGILTGEVGTAMTLFHNPSEDSKIVKVFRLMENYLRGTCIGMVDINTIMDCNTGELTLIEFTMRFGRPTMEVQMSLLRKGQDFGSLLYDIASDRHNDLILSRAFHDVYDTAVGITVFTYGLPVLGWDNGNNTLPGSVPFDAPAVDWIHTHFHQLFSRYDHAEDCYVTTPNERQFIVVGLGSTGMEARYAAYKPLDNFNLLGCTWRDDVGQAWDTILHFLREHEVIYPQE